MIQRLLKGNIILCNFIDMKRLLKQPQEIGVRVVSFLEWVQMGVQFGGSKFFTVFAQDLLKFPFNSTHEPSLNYRQHTRTSPFPSTAFLLFRKTNYCIYRHRDYGENTGTPTTG